MTMIEDPRRQLSYLQQCLSSDKKPLGLFLGAGCPMAIRLDGDEKRPLIPDVAGITLIVRDDLAKRPDCEPLLKIVEEHFAKDGRDTPTMEDMLTHIRALRAVAGKDEVRGLSAENLDKLDDTICQLIHRVADKTLPCGCRPGEAKITRGYRLPARHVIHTVGPVFGAEGGREAEILANCYRESLRLAREHRLKTVAFPAISTGAYGYPLRQAASVALPTVKHVVAADEWFEEIRFVLWIEDAVAVYREIFQTLG